jgi:hypothetical protein
MLASIMHSQVGRGLAPSAKFGYPTIKAAATKWD